MSEIPDLRLKPLRCTLCRAVRTVENTRESRRRAALWRVVPTPGTTTADAVLCPRCQQKPGAEKRAIALTIGPAIYPCGCSRLKVDIGKCDHYQPGDLP